MRTSTRLINALFERDPYFAAQGLFEFEVANDLLVEGQKALRVDLPEWLTFDPETLSFTGTPPAEYVGILPLRIDVPEDTDAGTPAYAIIRDLVVDDMIELTGGSGFSINVFDDFLDLVRPEDFHGAYAIEYTARDNNGAVSEDPAIIVINVAPQPELPDAGTDRFEVKEDETIDISIAQLLQNDRDDDGDPIRILRIDDPDDASIVLQIPELSVDYPDPASVGSGAVFSATLANGDPLHEWLSLDSATGRVYGAPPLSFKGMVELLISHTNGEDSGSQTVALDVDGNRGASFTFTPDPGVFR